ncbi:hypothetical protein PVA45_07235 (plasmid) [Entomospira entomophila]|uniref:Uncharacterized protein n=1 Tax=Entomospira entomophila TaxID=2719988 RepID=A0A968GD13_9SPIO|nr:hypothetical protein [Entomospira entomophilus]NIZ41348.1 hypothetical protein [Entomospira entomophilus]WDI36241.1 hypothetical protein PVA45_07235 [Entomospira entomophilus]
MRLESDQVDQIYDQMCAIMCIDTQEREEEYLEATEVEQAEMDKDLAKIKRLIASRRLAISAEGNKIEYQLSVPIKQLHNEIHTLSFGIDSMKVGKLLKSQSNKNLSDADKGKAFVSTALNLPATTTEEMILADFTRISEVVTFFTVV